MEFWDALEDSQYLDAVASVRDGPRPICKWEVPTEEQLVEWETRVKARTTCTTDYDHDKRNDTNDGAEDSEGVEPLSLEWYVSSPIGFFFFSSFVKARHLQLGASTGNDGENGTHPASTKDKDKKDETNTAPPTDVNHQEDTASHSDTTALRKRKQILADQHAFVRMNFIEDLLRFQKNAKTQETRHKQVNYGKRLLQYVRQQTPPTTATVDDQYNYEDDTGPSAAAGGGGTHHASPVMTLIRECDLKLPRTSVASRLVASSSEPAVAAILKLNFDDDYNSNNNSNPVGLKGPLLNEFISTMSEWIEANQSQKRTMKKRESDPGVTPFEELSSQLLGVEQVDTHKSAPLGLERPAAVIDNGGSKNNDDQGDGANGEAADIPDRLLQRGETNGDGTRDNPNEDDQTSKNHRALHPSESYSIDPIIQKVEAVVYESLRRDYEAAFRANTIQYKRMRNFLWYQDRCVVYDDFYVMRVLGRGGFGLVSACQKGTTGKLYAMKVMSKRRIKNKKSVHLVMNERKALAAVAESPFIINLKYSLHSADEVYLILDLMSGGDLGFHLHQRRKFGPNQCLYYAARIMLGLQALHDKGYAYRDLKPENCLLSEDGRVKLTDLGLATRTSPNLPSGVVGTRGYWAPEMHKRDESGKRIPYNHVVDWFSFGCCLAEFISGKNPFRSQAAFRFGVARGEKAKDKALDVAIREMDPEFDPATFPTEAADLCRRLLDKDPTSRLGAHGGCEEIMAHPWFKSVEWESIITDRKKPPFIPAKDVNAASQHEIGNFADDTNKASRDVVFDDSDEAAYKDWDWTNPDAMTTEILEFLIFERDLGRPLLPESMSPDLCCCTVL